MIRLNDDMTIEYDGKDKITVEKLLAELGMRVNPPVDPVTGKGAHDDAAEKLWHEFSIQATEFLKYCPISRCCGDMAEESQRTG